MDQTQLTPIADVLLDAYVDRLAYSRRFLHDHGQPPTLASKAHHMRSVAQALVTQADGLMLGGEWSESGRVEITDLTTDRRYLLRGDGAVKIERDVRQIESLFPAAPYISSDVVLLVYRFHHIGLDLSVAGTKHRADKKHLEISGTPTFIATWPWSDDDTTRFEQGFGDDFGDLGDFGEGDVGEGDNQ